MSLNKVMRSKLGQAFVEKMIFYDSSHNQCFNVIVVVIVIYILFTYLLHCLHLKLSCCRKMSEVSDLKRVRGVIPVGSPGDLFWL